MTKWMRISCAALLTAGLLVSLTGCGGSTPATTTPAKKKIVVGTEATYRPFEWKDEKGEITGFDVDLAREIGKELGVEVEIKNTPFDNLIAELQNQSIDMVASAMTITEKRKENIDFSQPYYDSVQAIIVKEGSPIKTLADLKDKNVGVQNGTTGMGVAEKLMGDRSTKIKRFETCPDALNTLRIDGLDAVIADKPVAQNYLVNNTDAKLLVLEDPTLEKEQFGLAIRKGDGELLKKINDALDKLEKSGKIKELNIKYFGSK
ncbi:transporter substrate-binding domain-containing protein [Heliobacterium gestii]|uniref:Transporter substrate-binding domain-containing protein n=1 Tax=Heliomicrobium gestii TaxID=2699 RepID=A0A845LFI6_HELGE|nr:basic amino acid ABC transporter substrate-binding protein [Heliomicrobium gestii]MBM7868171.1 polar amino acid transport system substrate-binding protein [Heliomicrobium gestii]MZP43369.1 transporter substrate-binding domain-containing protein [Heliomicrobium gestii]